MILLDVPARPLSATLQRLDQFIFSEDVQLADLVGTLAAVWIHGPEAAAALEQTSSWRRRGLATGPSITTRAAEFRWLAPSSSRASDQLGVPGFVRLCRAGRAAALLAAHCTERGAVAADAAAIEAARIEAGYPLFGVDMTDDTIPLEAGIEERAISFSKGCYVGQEVIIRVLHRGHGRVARKLVALARCRREVPARARRSSRAIAKSGGDVSAAGSPRFGAIALGYVHRDFIEPGDRASNVEDRRRVGRRPPSPRGRFRQQLNQLGIGGRKAERAAARRAAPTASPVPAAAAARPSGRTGKSAARPSGRRRRASSRYTRLADVDVDVELLSQLAREAQRRAFRPDRSCRRETPTCPARWTPACRRVTRKRWLCLDDGGDDDDHASRRRWCRAPCARARRAGPA